MTMLRLRPLQWTIVVLAEILVYYYLMHASYHLHLLAVFLFTFVPLCLLLLFAKSDLRQLIRKPSRKGWLWGTIFGISAIIVQLITVTIVQKFITLHGNPIANIITHNTLWENLKIILITSIQLFGEELIVLIPFMLIAQLLSPYMRSNRAILIIAWLASSAIFGLLHASTYGSAIQALIIIGIGRLLLSSGFMKTGNLTTSYISHMILDNLAFMAIVIFS